MDKQNTIYDKETITNISKQVLQIHKLQLDRLNDLKYVRSKILAA